MTDPSGLFGLAGVSVSMGISGNMRAMNATRQYVARQLTHAALETGFEGLVASLISSFFGIENEFNAGRTFTTNAISNLATGKLGGFRRIQLLVEFVIRTVSDIAFGESVGWAVGVNAITLGTPALASMGSKLLQKVAGTIPPGVFSGYGGGFEYVVENLDLMFKTKNEWTDFFLRNKPPNAKVIFTDISSLPGITGHANGYIDPKTGNIFIDRDFAERFPHLVDGAIMEELYHFKQFVRDGYLGMDIADIVAIDPNYINSIEGEVATVLQNSGLRNFIP